MAVLSAHARTLLTSGDFAVPEKRALPLTDAHGKLSEDHIRLAWDMVGRTRNLTPAERTSARRRILAKAHELKIDTKDWKR